MAVGKNKRLSKGGKKSSRGRKIIDPFTRKEWYDIKAPSLFTERQVGKTIVNKTAGKKLAADALMGRVFEVNLADLNKDEDQNHRKIKLIVEDIQGRDVLTSFHGLDFTTDKLRALVHKWHTLIENAVDVRTSDGYTIRVFVIGFTRRRPNQERKVTYAQASQVRAIRAKISEIVRNRVSAGDLRSFVKSLIPESIAKEVETACNRIFPLQNVHVRKVKVLSRPKVDIGKLMEWHGKDKDVIVEDKGKKVTKTA